MAAAAQQSACHAAVSKPYANPRPPLADRRVPRGAGAPHGIAPLTEVQERKNAFRNNRLREASQTPSEEKKKNVFVDKNPGRV